MGEARYKAQGQEQRAKKISHSRKGGGECPEPLYKRDE